MLNFAAYSVSEVKRVENLFVGLIVRYPGCRVEVSFSHHAISALHDKAIMRFPSLIDSCFIDRPAVPSSGSFLFFSANGFLRRTQEFVVPFNSLISVINMSSVKPFSRLLPFVKMAVPR